MMSENTIVLFSTMCCDKQKPEVMDIVKQRDTCGGLGEFKLVEKIDAEYVGCMSNVQDVCNK